MTGARAEYQVHRDAYASDVPIDRPRHRVRDDLLLHVDAHVRRDARPRDPAAGLVRFGRVGRPVGKDARARLDDAGEAIEEGIGELVEEARRMFDRGVDAEHPLEHGGPLHRVQARAGVEQVEARVAGQVRANALEQVLVERVEQPEALRPQ